MGGGRESQKVALRHQGTEISSNLGRPTIGLDKSTGTRGCLRAEIEILKYLAGQKQLYK